ncbi:hypothetical protein KBY82_11045 [Cyanobium sp. AMD-g]|nr:hypothetical protein [Cyanobium sp. AMD-g]
MILADDNDASFQRQRRLQAFRQWIRGVALVAEVTFLERFDVAINDDRPFLSVSFMAIKRVLLQRQGLPLRLSIGFEPASPAQLVAPHIQAPPSW